MSKIRHDDAKRRRDLKEQKETRNKVLQYFRWDLIKYTRSEALGKKFDELELMRYARTWCIRVTASQVYTKLLQILKIKIESRRINLAKLVIAHRMVKMTLIRIKKKGPTFTERLNG